MREQRSLARGELTISRRPGYVVEVPKPIAYLNYHHCWYRHAGLSTFPYWGLEPSHHPNSSIFWPGWDGFQPASTLSIGKRLGTSEESCKKILLGIRLDSGFCEISNVGMLA
jgi:hypothetical protein